MGSEEYSIWIMPDMPTSDKLQGIITGLSKEYGSPNFKPHITLIGRVAGAKDQVIQKTKELTWRISPFSIRFGGIATADKYFRCVFVKVDREMGIMTANSVAAGIFGAESNGYAPHISLLYGDFPQEKRSEIAKKVEEDGDPSGAFHAETIRLYMTSGKPAEWKLIEEFTLNGP